VSPSTLSRVYLEGTFAQRHCRLCCSRNSLRILEAMRDHNLILARLREGSRWSNEWNGLR